MLTNRRILEIKEELDKASSFFSRVSSAIRGCGDEELIRDLEASPEFFEEIKDMVGELMEHRNFIEYKKELRAVIPELSNAWVRRSDSVVKQIWKDVVGVVSE